MLSLEIMEQDNRKVFQSEVRTDSENAVLPEIAVYVIDEATARQIVNLAKLVKEQDLYKVEKFDYRVTYYKEDGEALRVEDEEPTDGDTMNVTEDHFWFVGYLKHTSTEVRTDRVRIDELVKHFALDTANNDQAELYSSASPGM